MKVILHAPWTSQPWKGVARPRERNFSGSTVHVLSRSNTARSAGSPAASAGSSFTDVVDGAFYDGAVDWAVANGVTQGTTTTTFSPNDGCTRGQIVTFLYRYLAA